MRKVFTILLFTYCLAAYPATYYIDPSGQDVSSRTGSKTAPWKTLAYACSRVRASGDIIHVNTGTYNETAQSNLAAGVSIEGDGVNSNIISHITKLNTFTILLSSSSEAADGKQHISNLRMDGNSLTAYGAIRVAYRKNVEIYSCTFVNFNYAGVSFINGEPPSTYATGNKFHDNTITNCSGYFDGNLGSLEIQGQDGMLIYNNNFTLNRSDGMNGDLIYGVEGFLKNVKIYNNILNKTFIPETTPWDFAIEFWNCQGGVEIYDNTITGSIDLVNSSKVTSTYCVWIHDNIIGQKSLMAFESIRGILLEATESDIIIERNLISNVAVGVFLDQIGSARTVSNLNINSNIFTNLGVSDAGDNSKGWGIYWTAESYKNHTVNNINICNNVIQGHSGSRSTMWGINLPHIGTTKNVTIRNNIIKDFDYAPVYAYTQTGSETIDVLSIENNIFYQTGNNNTPKYTGITPTNNTTRNNIASNPLFVSSSDFRLQPGSPAIGKGLRITGVTIDYDGKAYNDPPSIGAYEYFVPIVPVYQSALIGNSSPAVLEMTFNNTLANIIPATSAFTVLVNSVGRSVNSAAITGSKISLTLSSAVVAGDVITVSYTKPATNPIQTPSGGQAENITSKPVTNNVASVVPVYTGAVIENTTPTRLEMTYSLGLANVIPANSAFNVQVNATSRSVSSVAISGNKVLLTLSAAAKFGDIVTVSYTQPPTNKLQGTSGSAAATISAKPVTNNISDPAKPNDPPIVVITNEADSYSGFIGEIDGSGTYDLNNDPLTYEWTVPADIPVSSTTESKIRFLSPVFNASQTIQFQLKVSDGLTSVTKSASVNILPYKPEIQGAIVAGAEASDYESSNYPQNVLDGNYLSNWAISGDNQWLLLSLSKPYKVSHIGISFLKGQKYSSAFDIYASPDNINWDPILIEAASCDFSGDAQVFDFPAALTATEYTYIKFIGHGNSKDAMNTISEFTLFGVPSNVNTGEKDFVLYPNPAGDFFNIATHEQIIAPDFVRIFDLSGKIVYENFYESGPLNVQIPSYIKSGVYLVTLSSGSVTLFVQQIVINR
jgi:uncharacterized repeat protein (TIGR02059 family)